MKKVNYKFEKLIRPSNGLISEALFRQDASNFTQHNTVKSLGGNLRFRSSHSIETCFVNDDNNSAISYSGNALHIDSTELLNYIIPVGVADNPDDWTGKAPNWPHSIFKFLNNIYLTDLQNGRALFLIDQSLEGYHEKWLWDWFHIQCINYNIDPSAIIYITGNQAASDEYNEWHGMNAGSLSKLKIIPSVALAMPVYKFYKNNNFDIKFTDLLTYKKTNIQNISLYDCINFKLRRHRLINFMHLEKENLLGNGLISMESSKDWPLISPGDLRDARLPIDYVSKISTNATWVSGNPNKQNFGDLIPRILKDTYANTWVSLTTESSYYRRENTTFISEKTFKPIACMQPFIILGSKGTLKYLRKLGYKTFNGFIDESYDECEDGDRFIAVINALKKIQNIQDKVAWYESMQDILEHNHKLFLSISTSRSIEHLEIIEYYKTYFKESDV